jgi:single-strand DNA-binding protein
MGSQVVILCANLGNDSELRYTPNGKPVVNFDLPIDIGYGEDKKTMWVRCSMFGERAEKLQPYLLKGKGVQVVGEYQMPHIYEGKNGQGVGMSLNVNNLSFVGGVKNGSGSQSWDEGENATRNPNPNSDEAGEIPF